MNDNRTAGDEFLYHFADLILGRAEPPAKRYTPDDPVKKEETVLGTLTSPLARELYSHWRAAGRALAIASVDAADEDEPGAEQLAREVASRLNNHKDCLKEAFWCAVHTEIGRHDCSIGLRANWQIVEIPAPQNPLAGILQRLTEGVG